MSALDSSKARTRRSSVQTREHILAIPADLFVTSSAKLAGIQNQPMKASIGEELLSIPDIELVDPVRLLQHDALDLRIFVISLNSEVYATRGKPLVL